MIPLKDMLPAMPKFDNRRTKHDIPGAPHFYFIIRPGIDELGPRACLYHRTNEGDKWISNRLQQEQTIEELTTSFTTLITTLCTKLKLPAHAGQK